MQSGHKFILSTEWSRQLSGYGRIRDTVTCPTSTPMPQPGDPRYMDTDEMVRRELVRRAEYEALPSTIALRRIEAAVAVRKQAERDAKRKRPKHQTSTDYPWMKPGWKW